MLPTITKINNFSLNISTVNGSGSQSANTILAKTLFRMGVPVGAKNLFPSNIAGLATWFSIRVNSQNYVGRRTDQDIVVAKNPESLAHDVRQVSRGGYFFYDHDFKLPSSSLRSDVINIAIPYRDLVKDTSDSIKMRKLLSNMIYVGVLAELLSLNQEKLESSIESQFLGKPEIIELNKNVVRIGQEYAKNHLDSDHFSIKVKDHGAPEDQIFIDGNSAAALGAIAGGCTFLSWYPITPSSSLAESFEAFAKELRTKDDQNCFAVIQAEDELSAINMTIGASWAGSRAMTATSGPGLSLMAEAAGLSYFAEIPAVIWDVQRAGPSTGLPTRTLQGDVLAAAFLSHGDTEHILLFPANPNECFDFARTAFDIAEELQTLVIVLSDLDLGMNLFAAKDFKLTTQEFSRGKVLTALDLQEKEHFARYADVDGDGIPYRTLPGTFHSKAAFFTRGTGHNEDAAYTEDAPTYEKLLNRLKRKTKTYRENLPEPLVLSKDSDVAIIAYGSTDLIIPEVISSLEGSGSKFDYLRIRSFPFSSKVKSFLHDKKRIFVIEQNRDAQMAALLKISYPECGVKIQSILNYDGLPITAQIVVTQIESALL